MQRQSLPGILALLAVTASSTGAADHALAPERLRCEYLENPQCVDVINPRLSWIPRATNPEVRGLRQGAYQVQVASAPALLEQGKPDLWDSGKVDSDETIGIAYAGKALESRSCCHWRVRVWSARSGDEGKPSAWSQPAQWTMGLLDRDCWQGTWITAPMSQPQTTAHFGYRSRLAREMDTVKWVQIDLGETQSIEAVRLWPTWPLEPSVAAGSGFPVRFKIEVADQADFANCVLVVDRTGADVPNPGLAPMELSFTPTQARFVRLTATRLSGPSHPVWDEEEECWRPGYIRTNGTLALAEMEVLGGGVNLGLGKQVTALDEWDDTPVADARGPHAPPVRGLWSCEQLTDGRTEVEMGRHFQHQPVTMLRREFGLTKPVRRATLFATARGVYEIHLNGRKVGDHRLAPGWTIYDKRILYQTHEVTELLQSGPNAVGALLADGWYRMRKQMDLFDGLGRFPCFFRADDRWLLAQLEIEYADGSREIVASDASWQCHTDGPIRRALIFDGYEYDARKEIPGWDEPGFSNAEEWETVREQPVGAGPTLSGQMMEPVRVRRSLPPIASTEPSPGVFVFDFGEELSGVYRIRLRGPAGAEVRVRHAEALRDDGQLYVANLMGIANHRDLYWLSGDGPQTFSPRFTYYGFRYLEVTGVASAEAIEAIEALEVTSDVAQAAHFSCSDERLNHLCRIVDRAYRSNMPSVTVDVAGRDERMPWMGDCYTDEAQSLSYLYDYAAFSANEARMIDDALNSDGMAPANLGHVCPEGADAIAGWCDVSVAAPYIHWVNYADRAVLRRGYEGARRYMDTLSKANPDGVPRLRYFSRYGDWLGSRMTVPPGAEDWKPGGKGAPQPLFAAALWAYSADLTARMAETLGETEDAQRYQDLATRIRAAMTENYVQPDGTVSGNEQSSYALLLGLNLMEGALRERAHGRLLEAIQAYGSHLATGSFTTLYLLEHLAQSGHQELAYQLVMQPSCPSYGHMLDNGATAMWERFDAWRPKLGFNPHPMNSFNHLGMNSVYQWIIGHVAGIQPDPECPGYKHFFIAPKLAGGLTSMNASYDSVRGRIESSFALEDGALVLRVTVPPNTTATIHMPAPSGEMLTESGQALDHAEGVRFRGMDDGHAVCEVQSGHYELRSVMR